jgi:hypothetical protein
LNIKNRRKMKIIPTRRIRYPTLIEEYPIEYPLELYEGEMVPLPVLPPFPNKEEAEAIRKLRGMDWRRYAIKAITPIALKQIENITAALYIEVAQNGLKEGQTIRCGGYVEIYNTSGWWGKGPHKVVALHDAYITKERSDK